MATNHRDQRMPDHPSTQIALTQHDGTGQIIVNLESFFEFSFEMEEDLADLVARHQHLAAPAAGGRTGGKRKVSQ